MAVKTKTKTEAVRQILKKINAIVDTPPVGWHQRTIEELEKQDLSVHPQHIYNVRKRALDERKFQQEEKENAEKESALVGELLRVKFLADELGGLDELSERIDILRQLSE